jgi:hypothetical protein
MNKEQFGQFWEQLKTPLKAKWVNITEADLVEIKGDFDAFGVVLQQRYGEIQKAEIALWADRRYAHWSGNYLGYKEEVPRS